MKIECYSEEKARWIKAAKVTNQTLSQFIQQSVFERAMRTVNKTRKNNA